jgi:cell division protein FtsB
MAQIGRMYDSFHEYDNNSFQPTDRFYVRPSVYLPNGDMDTRTGMLRQDTYRRGRTQAMRMEAQRLDHEYDQMMDALQARQEEKGLRVSLRNTIIGFFLLALVLAIVLLVQQGMLAQRQRMLRAMNTRIETVQSENTALKTQIDEASDSAAICYAAARELGMVPAGSTQAINLTAMDTRPSGPDGVVTASASAESIASVP